MELITKFLRLYPELLKIVSTNDFTLFIAVMFILAMVVNVVCYFIWGRY